MMKILKMTLQMLSKIRLLDAKKKKKAQNDKLKAKSCN